MSNYISLILIASMIVFGSSKYNGSTNAAVILAGGIVKAQNINIEKKYKRKDCPVCEGKGYYISGDKITKVNCGYCEPEKTQINSEPAKVLIHPVPRITGTCQSGTCRIR